MGEAPPLGSLGEPFRSDGLLTLGYLGRDALVKFPNDVRVPAIPVTIHNANSPNLSPHRPVVVVVVDGSRDTYLKCSLNTVISY